MTDCLPFRSGRFTLLFRLRVVNDITGFVEHCLTLRTDLRPDLFDSDGSTVNLCHLLALLPGPRLEAGHLAGLLSLQHTWKLSFQAEWSTPIGPDQSKYCALIGGKVYAITTHLTASKIRPTRGFWFIVMA